MAMCGLIEADFVGRSWVSSQKEGNRQNSLLPSLLFMPLTRALLFLALLLQLVLVQLLQVLLLLR